MNVLMQVCIKLCMYAVLHGFECADVWMDVRGYACMYVCMHVRTYVDAFACFCLSCFCCPAVMLAAELVRCIELRRKTCAPKCFEPVNPKVWFIGFRESPTVSL